MTASSSWQAHAGDHDYEACLADTVDSDGSDEFFMGAYGKKAAVAVRKEGSARKGAGGEQHRCTR